MMHWFKKHPQILRSESDALKKNINYREKIQVRDNLFISHGTILVRREKVYRFPILVVYTDATPYELPAIFPLKEELSEELVKKLASMTLDQLQQTIPPYIHFRYELRHQNATGALCILEWDNLDDGSKFYGISSILDRVTVWCRGTITGEFPPDSQEVEFCSHFNAIDPYLKFIYPEHFLDPRLTEGDAYALKYSFIPKGNYYPNDRTIFAGSVIIGKTQAGLFGESSTLYPKFLTDAGIKTLIDLEMKAPIIERFIENGDILKMPWFQVDKEPSPFKYFQELISIIGEGDIEKGKTRTLPYLLNQLKKLPDDFFIAIRFPNRKEQQEFQVFRVLKKTNPPVVLVDRDERIVFESLISMYSVVCAVEGEKLTDEGYHLRNTGRVDRQQLKSAFINIVGVGALGSEISDIMAKAGTGTLRLFDNQVVKAHNPLRHLAGLEHIGLAKVDAVASIVANHNPFIHIEMDGRNINRADLNDIFQDGSVTISSMAEDNTEAFLNERAVIANKIVYYVRALRGGKAARIFRVIPGKDACFNCLDLFRNEGRTGLIVPPDPDLPTLKNECNNPVRPASAADLKLIASLASRIIIDEMQSNPGQDNHWIWSTEELDTFKPYSLHKQFVAPHPGCYYCNHEHKFTLEIKKAQLDFMKGLVADDNTIETGGVMAGFIDNENKKIVIDQVSGPGPNATRSRTEFQKDIPFCQGFLDELFKKHGEKAIYMGEWHSHPSANNHPSNKDIKSLTEIAYQKEYLTDMPAMIILSEEGNGRSTIHPAGKIFYETKLEIVS